MDLDGRGAGPGDFPAESAVGSAQRLAANRSGAQRAAIQERGDLSTAIFVRAGSFYAAAGAAGLARGSGVVFRGEGREALPFSRLVLRFRARDFRCAGREIVLRAADLSAADGGGRRRAG